METQDRIDYDRIARAIGYIRVHFREQPSLETLAAQTGLSPSRFQRIFTAWAGVSPKKFLQYVSLAHARQMLSGGEATLFDAAFDTGLSGTGRLHDLFVTIEGMTPGEYGQGGRSLDISYSFAPGPFGETLVASTPRGLCYMAFCDGRERALDELRALFPNARYRQRQDDIQCRALSFFSRTDDGGAPLRLRLKGTPFQLKVWEALLRIPEGRLTTYGRIARQIGSPNASRAVGTAVGDNPVSYLIPCHRVIRSSGALGGYHWGLDRKTAMIGWEAAHAEEEER